jgi:excinuclease ABC subunit C
MSLKNRPGLVKGYLYARISKIPDRPGVYIMKDKNGRIIYIGKAKSLNRRVRSYFQDIDSLAQKQRYLVEKVCDVDYIITQTEAQALFLESKLIKDNVPKYNVSLKDDKSYPLVKITKEEYPAIFVCRPKRKRGAYFFGPFSSAGLLREALKVIRKIFPYRTCRIMPKSACLNYSLNLCPAPCIGAISKKEYLQNIKNISLVLEGKKEYLLSELAKMMRKKAQQQRFEEASKIKNQIEALSYIYKDRPGSYKDYLQEAEQLRDVLGLSVVPKRIEAFDISNIHGREAVGSLVCFYKGRPDKSNYRRFKIRETDYINDYKMLAEITRRRYERLKRENRDLPDLIIIDGGKGQLSSVKKELDKLNLDIPIFSIAKDKEVIFSTKRKDPIILPLRSKALQLVRRVRDEAHRFAVSYHHILRRKVVLEEG